MSREIKSGLLLMLVGLGFGTYLQANAQTPEEAIRLCEQETDLSSRIVCLEQALLASKPKLESPITARPQQLEPVAQTTQVAVLKPKSDAAAELGAEQIAPRNQKTEKAERVSVKVASTRQIPIKKLEITLSNGQVWRQIKGDSRVIRISKIYKDSLTAEVWRAPISGYKMRLNEIKKTIRVERIK